MSPYRRPESARRRSSSRLLDACHRKARLRGRGEGEGGARSRRGWGGSKCWRRRDVQAAAVQHEWPRRDAGDGMRLPASRARQSRVWLLAVCEAARSGGGRESERRARRTVSSFWPVGRSAPKVWRGVMTWKVTHPKISTIERRCSIFSRV